MTDSFVSEIVPMAQPVVAVGMQREGSGGGEEELPSVAGLIAVRNVVYNTIVELLLTKRHSE